MRLKLKETNQQEWNRYFTSIPELINGHVVWLEFVERKELRFNQDGVMNIGFYEILFQ
jgi:hypothetical protein